jgi:molybdopterin/thiamine biosynthesis adenylyltransferase
MRDEIRFTTAGYEDLLGGLLADEAEHAAILICGCVRSENATILTVRQVVHVTDDDLDDESLLHLQVSPLVLAALAKQASRENQTLIVAHSHPFAGIVRASEIDLRTEKDLCGRVLTGRVNRPVGALIVGPDGYDARVWTSESSYPAMVRVGGRGWHPPTSVVDGHVAQDQHARQVLIWGVGGQDQLHSSTVAVVGLGGTGSHVALQLAHLGIGRLILVDPDNVESSNLSRLMGAAQSDIGCRKVDVSAVAARRVRPDLDIVRLPVSVLDLDMSALSDADVVVCCTDNHGSRSWLNELAAQLLVTLIDLGVEVQPGEDRARAGGGVRVIRPGEPCLWCIGILDPAEVRIDYLSEEQRHWEVERGYVRDTDLPTPSVVALNGVVASMAVMELLEELVGIFGQAASRVLYRAEMRSVTLASTRSEAGCYVCGAQGVLGLGDGRLLPRQLKDARSG